MDTRGLESANNGQGIYTGKEKLSSGSGTGLFWEKVGNHCGFFVHGYPCDLIYVSGPSHLRG